MQETILVINAGSSSIKFQLFAVAGDDRLARRMRGQIEGIGGRPRLLARDVDGRTLIEASYSAADVGDVPAALGKVIAFLREQIGDGLYQHATLPVHAGEKLLRALVYVAKDARPARPSAAYRAMVLAAARSWQFPGDYLQMLEREMMGP